jgi:hypothetical protein
MCHHIQSTTNTNVKRGVNKLITNTRFHFVENIVIRGEITEQNPNGQCSIDFLFKSGSKKYLVCLWHYGTVFSITPLCLFSKTFIALAQISWLAEVRTHQHA